MGVDLRELITIPPITCRTVKKSDRHLFLPLSAPIMPWGDCCIAYDGILLEISLKKNNITQDSRKKIFWYIE